jgi:glycyl-tRNA synthetase beta chain
MDFLLEVGCEEIPARFVPPALQALAERFTAALAADRLVSRPAEPVRTMGTPRRLVLLASSLPEQQDDVDEEIIGPRVELAYDSDNRPTTACLGFMKSKGLTLDSLMRLDTPRGKCVGVRRRIQGKPTKQVLPELLRTVLTELAFPKTMRWGQGEAAFVRPVHWLVALLGEEIVPFEFAGIRSDRRSRGHRFAAPSEFDIPHPGAYIELLRERNVLVDPEERRRLIADGVAKLAADAGGRVLPDSGLEEEISFLIEYPVPLGGHFDEKFLDLPRRVLIAAMRNHQRYFSIERPDGALQNAFIAVGNTPVRDLSVVRHGNERVLAARLSDARFFFDADRQVSPVDRVPRLQNMIFQTDLGSYYDKAVRVASLAVAVSYQLGFGALDKLTRAVDALTVNLDQVTDAKERFSWQVARAALLAKTDLLTDMVGEFPELQGEMGGVYALAAHEEEQIATAIREQYYPRSSGDELPATDLGAILSLTDRIDTLVGCFGVGLRSTGGADPYALRRACLGVTSIILARGYRISVGWLLRRALNGVRDKVEAVQIQQAEAKAAAIARKSKPGAPVPKSERPLAAGFEGAVLADLEAFFAGRLRQRFAEEAPNDVVEAVLAGGIDDLTESWLRLKALTDFARQPAFENLVVAFKRVANILKGFEGADLDPWLLSQPEEKELNQVYVEIAPRFEGLVAQSHFSEALALLGEHLRGPVDRFFDQVLVNDPKDPARQANRKALLSKLAGLFSRIADFTKIQTRDSA